MPVRKRYRSTGALVSQIIKDDANLTTGGVTSSKFTDFEHRSSRLVFKKININFGFFSGDVIGVAQQCDIAIIAKPISEGVPVSDDFDNPKYTKWSRECFAVRKDADGWNIPDYQHWLEILKIVVELGWDIYVSVRNLGSSTNPFMYWLQLFVKYI